MNKFIIIQFFCVVLIHINNGEEDFDEYVLTKMTEDPKLYKIPSKNVTLRGPLPNYVNWVERGFNTPILHQRNCGSCYAFSSLGAVEAQYFIQYRRNILLSKQNIVDCSQGFGNNGCHGGWSSNVFEYTQRYGVPFEIDYPYYAKQYYYCPHMSELYRLRTRQYFRVPYGNEEELKKVVANVGPVPIAFDASHPSFKAYRGDHVYYEPNCRSDKFTHGMLLVGYGTTQTGEDYWLIKNSWGTNWGNKGFMKVARNRNNHCGVASHPIFPVGIDIIRV